MDVVRAPAGCRLLLWPTPFTDQDPFAADARARIYLVDLPGGSARILAIVTKADEDSFETVLAWAAPVIESMEFHSPLGTGAQATVRPIWGQPSSIHAQPVSSRSARL